MDDYLCVSVVKHRNGELRNGGFTINRTGNPSGNVGVDMALEQTINLEAK